MNRRFKYFVISIIAVLILPEIFREGMFMDGTLYSSVSLNYARGLGTFWHPHFAKVSMPFFHEQPPLLFGMLGTCFRIFGDSMFVERIYSLMIFIFSAAIFLRIWKTLFEEHSSLKNSGWWALLLWVSVPVIPFAVINNLEENTMGLFCLLAILFLLKSIYSRKTISVLLFVFAASVSLIAAFLTKGFPGLFPLCLPVLFYFFFRNKFSFKKIFLIQFFLMLFLGCGTFILYSYPPSKLCLETWLTERVINSIKNVSNSSSRFELLWVLFQQLLPVFIIGFSLFLFVKITKAEKERLSPELKRTAFFFIALACCASLPLLVTREQRSFYLCPSIACYATGLAILFQPYFSGFLRYDWKRKYLAVANLISGFIFLGAITVAIVFFKVPKRDNDKIHDIKIINTKIAYGGMIAVPGILSNDWELHTILNRTNYISIGADQKQSRYLLHDNIQTPVGDTADYKRAEWGLMRYIIYEKKDGK